MSAAAAPPTALGRLRVLSSTASIHVSHLVPGGMSIGDAWTGMGSMDKDSAFKLLETSSTRPTTTRASNPKPGLGSGWPAARTRTKYTADYKDHELGKGKATNHVGNSRRSRHMSIRDSLKKLQTDFIDILYLHWWDHLTSIEEVMDSLHILVEQGKVLYLGISDSPAWVVSAANVYARAHGKTPFSIYQGRWNVMLRDFEREIIPMARHFGMALCPWDVLGSGEFQSRKNIEERKAKGEPLRSMWRPGEQSEKEVAISEALAEVAAQHNVDSLQAIALAYVLAKAPRVFPLVGGRKVEHLESNIAALRIKLTPEQIAYLENVVPFEIGFPNSLIGANPRVTGSGISLMHDLRIWDLTCLIIPMHRR
jgi:aryl-alcohol dehydrogenase-like predicted oxidoreductase